MTLFEDKDVLVLNKPYGLATQGGSGQTRHIDGMLELLAKGDTRPCWCIAWIATPLACCSSPRTGRWPLTSRDFGSRQAKKHWALSKLPKPSQGRISLYLAKGAGMKNPEAAQGTLRKCASPNMARPMRSIR